MLPKDLHGCAVDRDGHVWLDGSEDGIVQEYSHDGKEMLLQIGKKGVFDSSDGTVNGTPLNSSPSQFFRVSEIAFDPHNGDMYVADGHAKGKGGNNFRIVVFDHDRTLSPPVETASFAGRSSHRGPADSALRSREQRRHRLCVRPLDEPPATFRHDGKFQEEHAVQLQGVDSHSRVRRRERSAMRCWWDRALRLNFPAIPGEKYMYVINEIDEEVDVVDRASGQSARELRPPGPPGRRIHARAHDGGGLQRQPLCGRVGGRPQGAKIQNGGRQVEDHTKDLRLAVSRGRPIIPES